MCRLLQCSALSGDSINVKCAHHTHTHTLNPEKGPEKEVLKQKRKNLGECCQLRRQLKDEGEVSGVKYHKEVFVGLCGFFVCLSLAKFYILTSCTVGLLTFINVMSLEI